MKTKVKILFVHHGGANGGAPRSLYYLIRELDRARYEPVVLVRHHGALEELFMEAGSSVIVREDLGVFHGSLVSGMSLKLAVKNLLGYWPSYHKFSQIIQDVSPDIVHLNSTCLAAYAHAAKKTMGNQVKVLCHIREPLLDNFWGVLLRKINLKYVDFFVSIDRFGVRNLGASPEKSRVVYNSVLLSEYLSGERSKYLQELFQIPSQRVVFLFLSRVCWQNGPDILIRAARVLENEDPDFGFVMAGFSKDKYSAKIKAAAEDLSNLFILDFSANVKELISSSDVMVSPFRVPHSSRAIIEGSAMGIPSIGPDIGSINELIQGNFTGYLYNDHDFESFLKAIIDIGSNSNERERLGSNALCLAREKFDSRKNAEKIMEVYENLFSLSTKEIK